MKTWVPVAAALALAAGSVAADETISMLDDLAAYEALKALEGEWQGEADSGGEEQLPFELHIEVVSGGKAVIERQFAGTEHEMVNVYYLAGGKLHATHYCSGGNQPAYRYSPDPKARSLPFVFAGGTGFDPAKDGHVHEGAIRILGPDAIEGEWTFWDKGAANGKVKWLLSRKPPGG